MECHSAITSNGQLIHSVAWINFKMFSLSEQFQIRERTYYLIPLIWNSRKCKLKYSDRKPVPGKELQRGMKKPLWVLYDVDNQLF